MNSFNIEKIKQIIIDKFHWGPSEEWTNFHFKELSKLIQNSTGDRISEETLKRIFGKRKIASDNYHPQAFSQMALLKFAESIGETHPDQINKKFYFKKSFKIAGMAIILFLFIITFIQIRNYYKSKAASDFYFSCDKLADYAPFTATFTYDISGIRDSVFSDFIKDIETYVPPNRNKINCFFPSPGIHTIRFYTREKVLQEIDFLVFSNNWQGGYYPNLQSEKFKPFKDQDFFWQNDLIYAPPGDLLDEEVNPRDGDWVSYRYFTPFKKSLDSLTLETRVMNNAALGSLICYNIGITLIGVSGVIDFQITQSKCERYAKLKLSEKTFDGEFDYLDALTTDMSDWLLVKVTTNNGRFTIALGDTVIFSETYSEPMNDLVGIIYYFYGTGKIDDLVLKENNGTVFYSNFFNNPNAEMITPIHQEASTPDFEN